MLYHFKYFMFYNSLPLFPIAKTMCIDTPFTFESYLKAAVVIQNVAVLRDNRQR